MAVRLKIRGKLVLSFSAVMVLVLSGLGYITYLTFADTIHDHKEQIAKAHLENIRLRLSRAITQQQLQVSEIERELAQASGQTYELGRLVDSGAIAGAALISQDWQVLTSYGKTTDIARMALQGVASTVTDSPLTLLVEAGLVLVGPPFRGNTDEVLRLAILTPKKTFLKQLDVNDQHSNGTIMLGRGAELLLGSQADASHQEQALLAQIHSAGLGNELTRVGHVFAIGEKMPELNVRLWYVLPDQVYLESIIELKNRVIAATIIILWCSIWIVLIVAHKIAHPIRALSAATHGMQISEYSVPLKYKDTGDEVGDLGSRFEGMRLHIEGLISKDALSGLYNRRYLMHALELEVSKAMRGHQPLCCLMMDLDHFKQVNDTYGHQCGDAVIKNAAQVIQASLRNYDVSARYGGEEFVVLLPMTTISDAVDVAERIRATIEKSPVHWEGQEVKATMSIGLSPFINQGDTDGAAMINAADDALYSAKRSGRNRVVASAEAGCDKEDEAAVDVLSDTASA